MKYYLIKCDLILPRKRPATYILLSEKGSRTPEKKDPFLLKPDKCQEKISKENILDISKYLSIVNTRSIFHTYTLICTYQNTEEAQSPEKYYPEVFL